MIATAQADAANTLIGIPLGTVEGEYFSFSVIMWQNCAIVMKQIPVNRLILSVNQHAHWTNTPESLRRIRSDSNSGNDRKGAEV